MSKAILEFDLTEEQDRDEYNRAVKAGDMAIALSEIANEVFRPARKHGYADAALSELIDKSGVTSEGYQIASEVIGKLEELFFNILEERGIDINEL